MTRHEPPLAAKKLIVATSFVFIKTESWRKLMEQTISVQAWFGIILWPVLVTFYFCFCFTFIYQVSWMLLVFKLSDGFHIVFRCRQAFWNESCRGPLITYTSRFNFVLLHNCATNKAHERKCQFCNSYQFCSPRHSWWSIHAILGNFATIPKSLPCSMYSSTSGWKWLKRLIWKVFGQWNQKNIWGEL